MDGAVVVGVDGSRAALNAVRWAAAEAVGRGVPLRIVHAASPAGPAETDDAVLTKAENVALGAHSRASVRRCVVTGVPADALVAESHTAAMVCVGSRPGRAGEVSMFGPTATEVAQRAHCPVAIIRSRVDGTPQTDGVVSVVLTDEAGNDDVVHLAMQEGRLRGATVRQIDLRADSWVRRYPDVAVELIAAGAPRRYVHQPDTDVGLAVVGRADAARLAALTVPNCHPIHGFPDCSVLVVR